MKVIISHDIDHYNWTDHLFSDLYIPKYCAKNVLYVLKGDIPLKLFVARAKALLVNRLNRLEELTHFNAQQRVPASYFIGVRNALNLSYNVKNARRIANYLLSKECPIYIHGIAYDNYRKMQAERDDFLKIAHADGFSGIRMHYLRHSKDTLKILSELGYSFDSTTYALQDPYKVANMLEFPVSMMDVYEMKYSDTDFEKIKIGTLKRIQQALEKELEYLTIIFHDNHFSDSFPIHKEWYIWLINYLKTEGYEFTDFRKAAQALARAVR